MNLSVFSFESREVRTVTSDAGEVLFVGKDVCDALGYTNASKAIGDHCKGVTIRYPLQTAGGVQEARVLTEADVLRLIVNSKLPAAEAFERWVFEEVLPSIRKTGSYTPAQPGINRAFFRPSVAASPHRHGSNQSNTPDGAGQRQGGGALPHQPGYPCAAMQAACSDLRRVHSPRQLRLAGSLQSCPLL